MVSCGFALELKAEIKSEVDRCRDVMNLIPGYQELKNTGIFQETLTQIETRIRARLRNHKANRLRGILRHGFAEIQPAVKE